MPNIAYDEEGGAVVRTLKQCPPFIDALNLGYQILLPVDVLVEAGPVFSWDWALPVSSLEGCPRSPLSFHVAAQGAGTPLMREKRRFLKFLNCWTIWTEPGVSVLVVHPLNRPDLPFGTLSGVVDTDRYGAGLIHFPSLWMDDGFTGVLPRGTPVAHILPFRRSRPEAVIRPMDPSEISETNSVRRLLDEEAGTYRKQFRASRSTLSPE